jgi:hypothetical protein
MNATKLKYLRTLRVKNYIVSVDLSPSLEVTSCAATQEVLKILCDLKVHYRI